MKTTTIKCEICFKKAAFRGADWAEIVRLIEVAGWHPTEIGDICPDCIKKEKENEMKIETEKEKRYNFVRFEMYEEIGDSRPPEYKITYEGASLIATLRRYPSLNDPACLQAHKLLGITDDGKEILIVKDVYGLTVGPANSFLNPIYPMAEMGQSGLWHYV